MILKPRATSVSQLHWDRESREYVGEISSTHGFGRVYDDACDEGMTLVNPTSGHEVVCVVERTERDSEGDVRFWLLRPAPGQRTAPFAVRLFND